MNAATKNNDTPTTGDDPFESGRMYEPLAHEHAPGKKDGLVDFDTRDGQTVATVFAHPSQVDAGVDILTINTDFHRPLRIYVNDGRVVTFDTNGNATIELGED
jgi:hypothetical protein